MVGGGYVGVVVQNFVQNVRRKPCGQESREVGAVMGVDAKFAANHRHSTGGVRARHFVEEVDVKQFCRQRAAVRGCFCGGGADC